VPVGKIDEFSIKDNDTGKKTEGKGTVIFRFSRMQEKGDIRNQEEGPNLHKQSPASLFIIEQYLAGECGYDGQ
jgi:hypothetical protein